MELILNNESLLGQYNDEQSFLDYLSEKMIPCLKLAERKNLSVISLSSIYGSFVCFGKTLGEITDRHPLEDAEIQRFKRLLKQLEPDKEFSLTNKLLEDANTNKLTLLSFYPSNGRYESCYIKLNDTERIRNVSNREQLRNHLINLKEIDYPLNQKYVYVIHKEEDGKHKGAHFHISAGGEESTVRIKDFKSASKTPICRSLNDGVELAKNFQEDLIELWDFFNPNRLYKDEE